MMDAEYQPAAANAEPVMRVRVVRKGGEVQDPAIEHTSRWFDDLPGDTVLDLYAAPDAAQAKEPPIAGRVCGYTPGMARVEIQMPAGTHMTGMFELGSHVYVSAAPVAASAEPVTAKWIAAGSMLELKAAIYKYHGWQRKAGESMSARISTLYDVTADHRAGKFVAVPKAAPVAAIAEPVAWLDPDGDEDSNVITAAWKAKLLRHASGSLEAQHGAKHSVPLGYDRMGNLAGRAALAQQPSHSDMSTKTMETAQRVQKPHQTPDRKRKVWVVSYIPGNPEVSRMGVYTDASGPHLRQAALDTAQRILSHSPRWRLWVHHRQTGERIFESDTEKEFQAEQGAT